MGYLHAHSSFQIQSGYNLFNILLKKLNKKDDKSHAFV